MGSSSTKTQGGQTLNQTTTPQPTPAFNALNQSLQQQQQAYQPMQTAMMGEAGNMYNNLLTGNVPSYMQNYWGVNQPQQNSIVQQSLQQLYPQLNAAGISPYNSGTGQAIGAQTAAGLYGQMAQGNAALQQSGLAGLTNLYTNTMQPMTANTGQLSQNLASLTGQNTQGTSSNYSNTTYNPSALSNITQGIGAVGSLAGGIGGLNYSMGNPLSTMFQNPFLGMKSLTQGVTPAELLYGGGGGANIGQYFL
jgi:hypothetical protein